MEHNVVVRMAKVLYGMVLAVFVFNLLVLPLVPGYTMMAYKGMGMGHPSISSLMGTMRSLLGAGVPAWEILVVRPLAMLGGDWSGYGPEVWWSAAFFLGCGICTAVLLWQARCILSTIIAQTPFQRSNARSMKRAAASCWGIALLAAVWFGALDTPLYYLNNIVWDLLGKGTGYIDKIAYSIYYAGLGTVV